MADRNRSPRYAVFQMYEPFRESIIEENRFYLEQAKIKLLSQFDNIDSEANAAGDRWLEKQAAYCISSTADPGSALENAYDHSIEYHRLLSEMRDQTRLSIIAAMYHAWDKKLRSWLVDEIRKWCFSEEAINQVWAASFDRIIKLLTYTGLIEKNSAIIQKLSTYRYVVNAYKHGDGAAFEQLKTNHREFLKKPLFGDIPFELIWTDYTDLMVDESHLDDLSSTISEFWNSIPSEIFDDTIAELPDWFAAAINKASK
ncbi:MULTISPECIES: hypothetical protein [Pseudomonas]|uniref:hypothetical protein n=1 Tax=Pseudomonas TaxID=286 RepID=UPI0007619B73|nr:hypothetical protein [Pseudomonas monteilii]